MYWIRKKKRKRVSSITKHYVQYKESARVVITQRIAYWNQFYLFEFNRIAIRNQRRCWGSCTSLKNLNFNYKIFFLPIHLQDYIIVHELCHLKELNHGIFFWELVKEQIPDYKNNIIELRLIEQNGMSGAYMEEMKEKRTMNVL